MDDGRGAEPYSRRVSGLRRGTAGSWLDLPLLNAPLVGLLALGCLVIDPGGGPRGLTVALFAPLLVRRAWPAASTVAVLGGRLPVHLTLPVTQLPVVATSVLAGLLASVLPAHGAAKASPVAALTTT